MASTLRASWIRLSTDTEHHLHHTVIRGSAEFDVEALVTNLAALPGGGVLSARETLAYRQFYGLIFPHIEHEHQFQVIATAQERLAVQVFQPTLTTGHVMLCHGYYDHVGLFGSVIEYLLKQHLTVIAFDQLGHGLSTGKRAVIDNFDAYVTALTTVTGYALQNLTTTPTAPLHWVAQSMGGAIVMEYLQQRPEFELGQVVLLAPLVRPYGWMWNRWVFALAKLTITERPRTLTQNAENAEFHTLQAIDPLQPRILPVAWVTAMVDWFKRFEQYPVSSIAPVVLQGDQDRTVDARHNLAVFARRYPQGRQLIIAGGRHHLANESADIRNQMWRYLDTQCDW